MHLSDNQQFVHFLGRIILITCVGWGRMTILMVLVCTLPIPSVIGTLCTRCTPTSCLSIPNTSPPLTLATACWPIMDIKTLNASTVETHTRKERFTDKCKFLFLCINSYTSATIILCIKLTFYPKLTLYPPASLLSMDNCSNAHIL